jgi:choline kinase
MAEDYPKKWNIIIPAAGVGRRLRPFTDNTPKSMVVTHGKTLLEHQLSAIPPECVNELILITGFEDQKLKDFVLSLDLGFPVNFRYNNSYLTSHCAYSLLKAREEMSKGFILINCDLLFSASHFLSLLNSPNNNVICAKKVNDYETDLQKINADEDNKVMQWELNLKEFNGEVMGPLKMSSIDVPLVLEYYDGLSEENKLQLPCFTLFSRLVNRVPFYTEFIDDDKWFEVDTVEDLKQTNLTK